MARKNRFVRILAVIAAATAVAAIPYFLWQHAITSRVDRLVAVLSSNDPYAIEAAEDQLAALKRPAEVRRLVWHLGDDGPVPTGIEAILARMGDSAVEPTVTAYVSAQTSGPSSLDKLVDSLRWLPNWAADPLREAKSRREARQRGIATGARFAMALMGDPAVRCLLIEVRETPNRKMILQPALDMNPCSEAVREFLSSDAFIDLARLSARGCTPLVIASPDSALMDKLTYVAADGSRDAVRGAAMVLAAIRSPAADAAIARILEGSNETARLTMARALAARGDSRATKPMIEALESDATLIRMDTPEFNIRSDTPGSFVWAMNHLDGADMIDALIQAWDGKSASVSSNAAGVLSYIAHRADAPPTVKQRALLTLTAALAGPNPEKRHRAAVALAEQEDVLALPVLTEEAKPSNPEYRITSLWGLGFLQTAEAAEAAEGALADGDINVRIAAGLAIGWTGKAGFPVLKRALSDPDPYVARMARTGLFFSEYTSLQEEMLKANSPKPQQKPATAMQHP
jgi:HEAT repeat protein